MNGALSTDNVCWWSIDDVATRGQVARRRPVPADAEDQLVDLLEDAVRLRLEADVPMGAFLSGQRDEYPQLP